ncbi:hypothetical protein [Kitasatospora sp. NPDC094011]|uniref:hypothetical protein n=1 Tax=Kitasatospora sp. NPDC094011 TaxID=3364090 RepID=UPI0037FC8DD1
MRKPFSPLSYTSEERARDHEDTAAGQTGTGRLTSMALAARDRTDAEFHERALALLDGVAAARPTFRKPKWALPGYASALFTAGRTEEAWATVGSAPTVGAAAPSSTGDRSHANAHSAPAAAARGAATRR